MTNVQEIENTKVMKDGRMITGSILIMHAAWLDTQVAWPHPIRIPHKEAEQIRAWPVSEPSTFKDEK